MEGCHKEPCGGLGTLEEASRGWGKGRDDSAGHAEASSKALEARGRLCSPKEWSRTLVTSKRSEWLCCATIVAIGGCVVAREDLERWGWVEETWEGLLRPGGSGRGF